MKSRFLSILLFFAALCAFGTEVLAEDLCPPGKVGIINADTRTLRCISPEQLAQLMQSSVPPTSTEDSEAPSDDSDTPSKLVLPTYQKADDGLETPTITIASSAAVSDYEKDSINKAMMASGWSIAGSAGYNYSHIDLRLSVGYDFAPITPYFNIGLFFDTNQRPGDVHIYMGDFTIVPRFHLGFKSFRFNIGLGIGIITFYGHFDESIFLPEDTSTSDMSPELKTLTLFEISPLLEFEWFLTESTWLGIGGNFPISFDFGDDAPGLETVDLATFDFFFTFGYKF